MKHMNRLLVPIIAATSLVGCSSMNEQQAMTPNFGSTVEISGQPHNVKQIEVIRCAQWGKWVVSLRDSGYQSVAQHNGAPDDQLAAYGRIAEALDQTTGLSEGEEIKSVNPAYCKIDKPVKASRGFVKSLAPEIGYAHDNEQYGTRAIAMYGTDGNDSQAQQLSADVVRILLVEQP